MYPICNTIQQRLCNCLYWFLKYSSFQAFLLGCSFDSFTATLNARSYVYVMATIAWLLPLFMISLKYYKIVQIVRKNTFFTQNISIEEQRARELEKSLFKMVLSILGAWILAWTPYLILHLWIIFGNLEYLKMEFAIVPTLCCKLSAAVNALLYGVR